MAHGTKVNGTNYGISGGKVLVGSTSYSVDKGRTLVNGTSYEVAFSSGHNISIDFTPGSTAGVVQLGVVTKNLSGQIVDSVFFSKSSSVNDTSVTYKTKFLNLSARKEHVMQLSEGSIYIFATPYLSSTSLTFTLNKNTVSGSGKGDKTYTFNITGAVVIKVAKDDPLVQITM